MLDPITLASAVMTRAATATLFLPFEGLVMTRPAKGYVSHYFGLGSPQVADMTSRQSGLRWDYRAVCIGYTPAQCRMVAAAYRALFLNWRPTGNPKDPWLTEAEDGAPLITDTSLEGDPRSSITLRYILNTRSI